MTDKELWYPEAEKYGYYLENDKIVCRRKELAISKEVLFKLFKERGMLPKDTFLCDDKPVLYEGKFCAAVASKEFPKVGEGHNFQLIEMAG